VVGAGSFGGHHARKYAGLDGVAFAGVFDTHVERAAALAGGLGARAFASLDELLDAVDVLTIASPASAHARTALAAIEAGKHVYVEKPLATTAPEAAILVAEAAARGLVLACGHQERVVSRAMGLLDLPERPLFLESVRRQTWGPRNLDVSCVLDLLIHDIDLALMMGRANPETVKAVTRTTHGPFIDEAAADITLGGGARLNLAASRIAEARERRMRIVFASGEVVVDFVGRSFVNTTPFALDAGFAETPAGRDPLGASVGAFLAAVRGEAARPAVTGQEAARALELALAVEAAGDA
jgi:predicted dehydrogenase